MSSNTHRINPSLDINSPRTIAATIYISVVGACVFIVQPGFIQGLVQLLGFNDQEAGCPIP
ncbi:MAG: hypothetical protein AAGF35_13120 [Pseudomonadota bacterium]